MNDRRRASAGFTLIEMVVVLIIMGLMLAFAGPRVAKSLFGLSVKTAAKKTAAMMRYARTRAVSSSTEYRIIFDAEKNDIILVSLPPDETAYGPESDNASGEYPDNGLDADEYERQPASSRQREIKTYHLPDNIFLHHIVIGGETVMDDGDDGIYQMSFYPNGTSQGGKITVSDPKERKLHVSADFMTGVVTVEEEEDE